MLDHAWDRLDQNDFAHDHSLKRGAEGPKVGGGPSGVDAGGGAGELERDREPSAFADHGAAEVAERRGWLCGGGHSQEGSHGEEEADGANQ